MSVIVLYVFYWIRRDQRMTRHSNFLVWFFWVLMGFILVKAIAAITLALRSHGKKHQHQDFLYRLKM